MLRARAQPLLWLFDDPTLGWRPLARGDVVLHRLPGNHATMMAEPRVQDLAERLRACIDRAEADHTEPARTRVATRAPDAMLAASEPALRPLQGTA